MLEHALRRKHNVNIAIGGSLRGSSTRIIIYPRICFSVS